MIAALSQHLRELVTLVDDLTFKTAEERCAHWILRHCAARMANRPIEIQLDRPKRVIAAELNVTSETLSRTLRKWSRDGLIKLEGKKIVVRDPNSLAHGLNTLPS